MQVAELIRKKRDGGFLTKEELQFLISGYVEERIPDYQMSAFLMACYFRGMDESETLTFTELMLHSGTIIDLSDIPGVKVDKHSTGGVGDKVSLILAPIVAACGVPVPMISGRGLGHTGGTLDKLESIPGFRTSLSVEDYKRVIRDVGAVLIGQTEQIAPADRKMYALRDVTATIECIPLIAGSILSKKLAEGIDALVLDVKTGSGAFMRTRDQALSLARALVDIGNRFGKETIAFVTDMNQPLGRAVGNWLEVVESAECLRGERGSSDSSADLMELTHLLAGAMLKLGKKAPGIAEGIAMSRDVVRSGKAFDKFLQMVAAQGGDPEYVRNHRRYPVSLHHVEAVAEEPGFIQEIRVRDLGLISVLLGAGREQVSDRIDHKAGMLIRKKIGDRVERGDVLVEMFTDREQVISAATKRVRDAFRLGAAPAVKPDLVYDVVEAAGTRPWR